MSQINEKCWYKEGVVYQIYPRSFKDSNGDGIGDLKGITSKIDYIASLGITIVWLSPVYCSPMKDNGYDISDYKNINPEFGTMEDFQEMLKSFHDHNIKVIMDLVVNHTSNEHYWFKEACKSKDNPYHDYYLWKDNKKNKNPNNWTSFFGGDAWQYVESCDQSYLHLFSIEQPDLNWENPKVKEEIKSVLRFWLDMGVDGFRCDVINILSKTPGLPNGKKSFFLQGREHYINGPKIHEYLQELKKDVFSKYDCFTVGECCLITPQKALTYIEKGKEELNMLFQFDHMACDNYFVKWFLRKFKMHRLKRALSDWQYNINGKGWNTLYFENHDQPRCVSRFGNEDFRYASATMLGMFLFLEQGTPYIFEGQEIGMTNPNFENLDDYQDVETHNIYNLGRKSFHFSHKRMMKKIKYMSRDNARTPMQWNDSDNAGFTSGKPWLKLNPNYKFINVQSDLSSKESIIRFYQKLWELRRSNETLVYGDYLEYYSRSDKTICFLRYQNNEKFYVVCNNSPKSRKIKLPFEVDKCEVVFSNYDCESYPKTNNLSSDQACEFAPYQGKVFKETRFL